MWLGILIHGGARAVWGGRIRDEMRLFTTTQIVLLLKVMELLHQELDLLSQVADCGKIIALTIMQAVDFIFRRVTSVVCTIKIIASIREFYLNSINFTKQ